ncbi:lipopolysaccharide biosynthesis protein [Pelobium manganitolerans]|uniref:lipopolysaccharide biosynthesis protein n=1 Tax=Pelobium manganitolerans TaxID=1842495 RepID=UPI003FA3666D
MRSIVLKNSLYSVIQIIATSACFLFVYVIIIKTLGKAQLGVWSLITAFPTAVGVMGSGVSGCILRNVPIYASQRDSKAFTEIIFNGVLMNFIIGLIAVFFGLTYSEPILKFLFNDSEISKDYFMLFGIALVTFQINFVNTCTSFALDGLQLIHLRNKITIAATLILCVASYFLIKTYSLKGIFLAQLAQSAFFLFASFYFIIINPLFIKEGVSIKGKYGRMFFTYGQKFQIISISIILFEPITKYFLNRYFNISTVALFDIVNRVVVQARTLIVSSIQVIVPRVSKQSSDRNLNILETYRMTKRGARLFCMFTFGLLFLVGQTAVAYLDPKNSILYLVISLFLMAAYYFNIIAATGYSIFMGLGMLRALIISHLISTVLNILLFICLGKLLPNLLFSLPVAISIFFSSIYIDREFRKKFSLTCSTIGGNDYLMLFYTMGTVAVVSIAVVCKFSLFVIFLSILFYFTGMTYLLSKNDFIRIIYGKFFING